MRRSLARETCVRESGDNGAISSEKKVDANLVARRLVLGSIGATISASQFPPGLGNVLSSLGIHPSTPWPGLGSHFTAANLIT